MYVSRAALAVAVLAGSAVAGLGGTGAPASAAAVVSVASGKVLPVETFSDLVVDQAHHRVLISDGWTGRLVMTNYLGTVLTVREGLPGISGLELSADSTTLYAAQSKTQAIVAFDAATLQETARYPLGADVNVGTVALAGGRLWFGYEDSGYAGNFGSVDLSGSGPVTRLHDAAADSSAFRGVPELLTSPSYPDRLVVADRSQNTPPTSGTAVVYDVSGETETRTGSGAVTDSGGFHDVTLAAGGANFLVLSNCGIQQVPVADISGSEPAYSQACPSSLTAATDGRVAVGHLTDDGTADVITYPAGSQTAGTTYRLAEATALESHFISRMAWEPGGQRLFVLSHSGDDGGSSRRLWVLNAPSAPIVRITAPATATRAKALTITGSITASPAVPAGSSIAVTRTDLESSSGKALGTVKTGASGAFKFTDTPQVGGNVTYAFSYAGGNDHLAASGKATVAVSRLTPALTVDKNKGIYSYGKTVTFTAKLGATYKNRVVEIWADPAGADQPNRLVKKATVNSAGTVSTSLKLTRNTTVAAKFTGDARYAPRTVRSVVYTKVAASFSLRYPYKSTRIGSQTYAVFRTSSTPVVFATMTAYSGRQQRTVLQRYSGGTWKTWYADSFPLSASGASTVLLGAGFKAGGKYRVRVQYVSAGSDNVNYSTITDWRYFTFTS